MIATKFGFRFPELAIDAPPANVTHACEGSLKRLGIETIDLFYQHRVDPRTPIEDTVGALAGLIRAGKVRRGSPLGRGFLSGRIPSRAALEATDYRHQDPRFSDENFAKTLAIVPIPGCKRRGTLEDSAGASGLALSAAEIARLDASTRPAAPRARATRSGTCGR